MAYSNPINATKRLYTEISLDKIGWLKRQPIGSMIFTVQRYLERKKNMQQIKEFIPYVVVSANCLSKYFNICIRQLIYIYIYIYNLVQHFPIDKIV
jgi:hypothetical protein